LLSDNGLADRVEENFETAGLDSRRVAILRYAKKLTDTPSNMQQTDVLALRTAGLEESDILELCEVVAYYAYANRIADGLGVSIED
jgi:uncharacterized peroxidase-related enzyme